MPIRRTVIATGETYHIYNKTVEGARPFISETCSKRMLKLLWFYHYKDLGFNFSAYSRLNSEIKFSVYQKIINSTPQVECHGYALMPNHFHLLAKQTQENGITNWLKNVQSSFGHWFNLRHKRKGPLVLPQFKIARIETDEQFVHVGRYIHLNPVTSYLVKISDIDKYPWTSWKYFQDRSIVDPYKFINEHETLNHFPSRKTYRNFTLDQADYQRKLNSLYHLSLD